MASLTLRPGAVIVLDGQPYTVVGSERRSRMSTIRGAHAYLVEGAGGYRSAWRRSAVLECLASGRARIERR